MIVYGGVGCDSVCGGWDVIVYVWGWDVIVYVWGVICPRSHQPRPQGVCVRRP